MGSATNGGITLVAGEMAQEFGILQEAVDIRQAIETVRDAWLGDLGNRPASVLSARAVQGFILRYRDSFRDALTTGASPTGGREIAGYYNGSNDLYLFTDDGFSEACGSHHPQSVAAELAARGLLHMNDQRHKSKQMIRQDGAARRLRFYAVKGAVLDTDFE